MQETDAFLILLHTPGLGPVKIRGLVDRYGSSTAVLDELEGLGDLGREIRHTQNSGQWQKDRDLAQEQGVCLLPYTHTSYPASLRGLPDAPALLYVLGALDASDTQSLAIVGTRTAGIYGREMAEHFGRELAAKGWTVVSGLARGVDTCAHQGALESGRTIAVIGSGLARIYPRENQRLAQQIAEHGAVISEYPMLTPPDRQHFPQRNRIVSGISRGTLLIEAPRKSGAMITMDRAKKQGRKLFALPGRADGESFRGNHQLIKSGAASLVDDPEDICLAFEDLFGLLPKQNQASPGARSVVLNPDEERLLGQLPDEEVGIEELASYTQLPISRLNILLMGLVLKKIVKEYPGRIYKKSLSYVS